MRGFVEAEALVSTESTIQFNARLQVLKTDITGFGTGSQGQRATDAGGIAELEGRVPDVLFGNEVFSYRPPTDMAAENELGFQFALVA